MFCRNCGKEIDPRAVVCTSCGVPPLLEKKFCQNCGEATQPNQAMCTKCGAALMAKTQSSEAKNKVTAGLLGIFLGWIGVHKFYLGYNKEAIIMLVISLGAGLVTCGAATGVMSIIGLIEGILYLTKTDEDFEQTYVQGHKGWF